MAAAIVSVFVSASAGIAVWFARHKRCPKGKLLVVYGGCLPDVCVVVDSGGRFVRPVIQSHDYLSLAPIYVSGPDDRRVAVRIGDSAELRQSAATRLLGLTEQQIVVLVQELLETEQPDDSGKILREKLAFLGLVIV